MNMNKIKIVVALVAAAIGGVFDVWAGAPEWTTNHTEKFWAAYAENSTRLSTGPYWWKEADEEAGEGILEAFGSKYLPNAYALYQEKRANAKEKEATLNENFPKGRESDSTGGKLYDKIAKAVGKAIAEMERRHDELCHYYLLHKAGVLADAELAKIDSSKICIMLVHKDILNPEIIVAGKEPTEAERTFAAKYMPAVLAGYDRLANTFAEGKKAYCALVADVLKLDTIRGGLVARPLGDRLMEIRPWFDKIADTIKQQKLLHSVEEATAEQIAEVDRRLGVEIQDFEKRLPVRDYVLAWLKKNNAVRDWARVAYSHSGLEFLPFTMVKVPCDKDHRPFSPLRRKARGGVKVPCDKDYRPFYVCQYEVTQGLWEAVMGNNPSEYKDASKYGFTRGMPVENVSWDDCQEFIAKLNALSEVCSSGFVYRLPTWEEWQHACRAGARDRNDEGATVLCKLADGTEVTVKWGLLESTAISRVVKIDCRHPHVVGIMEPNAFGLYDMLGNVRELGSMSNRNDVCAWIMGASWIESWHKLPSPDIRGKETSRSTHDEDYGLRLFADVPSFE